MLDKNRREFLKESLAGSAGLGCCAALGPGLWGALAQPERAFSGRTLVVVELTGGNDGLNTVIPFEDPLYHRARPTLALPETQVLPLLAGLGLHPALKGLHGLFQEGRLVVLQGVGMAEPARSHFRSLDRWHTGCTKPQQRPAGWLARALAQLPGAGAWSQGLALGSSALPLMLRGSGGGFLACQRMEELLPAEEVVHALLAPGLVELDRRLGTLEERKLAATGRRFLASLKRVRATALPGFHGQGSLAAALADILKLLKGGAAVPAFFVRTLGFDTHSRQKETHGTLLASLDHALTAFQRYLQKLQLEPRVLTLVYSEFGRRVRENGSAGTDHGSAAPVFLLGGGLPGGLKGLPPNLADLDDGDLKATLDFRRPLAQALQHLGHPSPISILGPQGKPLFS